MPTVQHVAMGAMGVTPTRDELEVAFCWENDDRVPNRPEVTDFRRRVRYHQAKWREANGHPIGSQPIAPRRGEKRRPVGSRIALDYARDTGATFVTPNALTAARARLSVAEPHQSFDHQRTWADLLWSSTLTFNLFGDLAADLALADRAVHSWWPDVPGNVREVRFAHSPGRFDWSFLGSLRDFDAALILDLGDGTRGIVAVDVKYHEAGKRHTAKPVGRPRQREVAERSAAFRSGAIDAMDNTELLVMSLEHLLMLSMLQHDSCAWGWGRYIVVHPEGNTDLADECVEYRGWLVDESTYGSTTLEVLLDANALPKRTVAALRRRYVLD
jgi:hypothetical protein